MVTAADYEILRTSTGDVPPADRAAFWVDHVRANHGLLDARFGARPAFRGGTVRQRGGGYQLVDFWSDGIAYARGVRQLARDPDEIARVVVPLRGRLAVSVGDDEAWLAPGVCGLLPAGAPFVVAHDDAVRGLVLSLPGRSLPARGRSQLSLRSGPGAVLGGMLRSLAAERHAFDRTTFGVVCAHVEELLVHLVARDEPVGSLALIERAFRDHVEAHADDPGLTGTRAAAALGWSLRQVQVALQQAGTTPRDVIRDVRLRHAHRRLSDPTLSHLDVTAVALASGFRSVRTFGDAFRDRYGSSPGQVGRERGLR